ncbi:hypothetical protein [Flavobacterium suzhouense]|uniref:Uncharacterized protein n=1 Tax=Flavobacterium suzhouense TaxID=1529638 RepID=A0ABW5NXS5_9FLAO
MKRKIILSATTLLLSCIGYSQECAKFKNGTFKFTDPKSKEVCIITRKDNIQTERMEKSDETYDFEIVWIDDCTYTVTPTPATAQRKPDVTKPGVMTVKITKTKKDSYIQKVTIATDPKFSRLDEVFVAEEKK